MIASVPGDVKELRPALPDWARDRRWNVRPKLWTCGFNTCSHYPAEVDGRVADCFPIPTLSAASWAVCVGVHGAAGSSEEAFRVVSCGLPGLSQSAYRAELFAVDVALCFASHLGFSSCRIWSDCASVVAKFRLLTTGCRRLNKNSRHVDLWQSILGRVSDMGDRTIMLSKVTAHVAPTSVDNEVESWLAKGNAAADAAAQAANRDRGAQVWALWKEASDAVVSANYVGDVIRSHLVEVNKQWYHRQGTDSPAVHATRMAKSVPMSWSGTAPAVYRRGQLRKFFGAEFVDRVQTWWNSLIDFDAPSLHWISYAELYLDWQLTVGHAGVVKLKRKWYEFSDPAMVPEQTPFRQRCKFFRLMVQQWSRDIKVKFATTTGRPSCAFLQCHIGCASIPVKRDRLAMVDAWLRHHVSRFPRRGDFKTQGHAAYASAGCPK